MDKEFYCGVFLRCKNPTIPKETTKWICPICKIIDHGRHIKFCSTCGSAYEDVLATIMRRKVDWAKDGPTDDRLILVAHENNGHDILIGNLMMGRNYIREAEDHSISLMTNVKIPDELAAFYELYRSSIKKAVEVYGEENVTLEHGIVCYYS